jgi:tetratricopeptide (TPR) repeat protein
MANSSLDQTTPSQIAPDSEPEGTPPRRTLGRGIILGIVVFLVIVGLGAAGGYQSGIRNRVTQATLQTAIEVINQYERARQDFASGNYEAARQRVEYVIQKNPGYPGAQELLTQILIAMQSTATPTLAPTPTLSPTPDLRGVEEMYQTALSLRNNKDWSSLLNTLDAIRKADPSYRTVEVDGLYYTGFRGRGIYRIQVEGNLEGGIFDLNRAEAFGPLDIEAQNYRQWAEWYITGASFWELDWSQVVTYFGYVVAGVPNLSDSTGFSSSSRLATAQVEYSYDLILQADLLLGQRSWCEANDLYIQAGQYAPIDPTVQPTAEFAYTKCQLDQEDD